MGVDDACVAKFADVFAWDINFFVDPQPGDSFEIIFDKKFLAGRFAGYGDILAAKYVNRGHVFDAIGIKDAKGTMRYYDSEGKSLQKQFLKAPLRFTHISSGFSLHRLHPVLGIVRPHLGIDYAAPPGTPVYAAADGVVCYAGYHGGFGNFIRIRHGANYETSYGHLRAFAHGVRTGARVSQGDLIGTVGQTGLATGPHLDYRMTIGQRFVNPATVSLPREKSVPPEEAYAFELSQREFSAIFNSRLKGKTGCFVLNVEELKAPSVNLTTKVQQYFYVN
jgi:murein DD-endopeptidase MepM/ murein hydrolase activator NlpD